MKNKIMELEKILNGELACDTQNLRQVYYDWAIKEKEVLEDTLTEIYGKMEDGFNIPENLNKHIVKFEYELKILNKYMDLLELREREPGKLIFINNGHKISNEDKQMIKDRREDIKRDIDEINFDNMKSGDIIFLESGYSGGLGINLKIIDIEKYYDYHITVDIVKI